MIEMAEETGGKAFMNTNDLSRSVTRAIEAGSNYYTLTYSPTDTNWNGDFRPIQVKLQQPGLTLAYRRGYYADNPNAPHKSGILSASHPSDPSTPLDAMRSAMVHGSPEPTEIIFRVRALPATPTPEDHLAANNVLNPAAKTKGPYRRYAIDYAADPRPILFNISPDGNHQGALRFVTYVYDRDGKLIDIVDDKTQADITPTLYLEVLRHGIPWHQKVSVPIQGDFSLRIAIQDLNGNRVGAVEVPVAFIQNLPPLTPSPTLVRRPSAPIK